MRGFEILDSGETLYVEENGAGAPLVCIHGLGGGAYFFTGLGEALKHRCRTIAFDLPGCGFSPRGCEPFNFDRGADMIVELASKRAGAPFTLLVHSLGTILALKIAARIPDGVRKIISVGGLPAPLPLTQTRLRDRANAIRNGGMLGLGDSIIPLMLSERSIRENPDMVFMLRRLLEMSDPAGYADMAEALVAASALDEAQQFRAPFFAITGSEDRYAPPANVEQFLKTLISSHPQRILNGCAHFPFFEDPADFYRSVEECLDA